MTPEELVEQVVQAMPGKLQAAVLYGSAAAGDFVGGTSNYNVLLVLERLGPAELAALSKPSCRWAKAGNRPPLLFTRAELASSADVFPIELLDMQQSRRILFGEDLLANVVVQPEHLWLQIERELKVHLLRLREGYLLAGGKPRLVADLLTSSIAGFLVLFRAALRLFQEDVPRHKTDAMQSLAQHIPFDPRPLLEIDALRHRRLKRRDVDPLSLFDAYLAAIERVVGAVDRHLHPEKGSPSP
ncbi:MAG: hypothetical protein WCB27_13890 [Thermoguttaceae bacterium]